MTAVVIALRELRHRVGLERPEEEPDGAGGVARTYAPAGEIFAAIEPLTAEETMRGYALGLARLYRMTLRARGDLTGGFRVTWRGRIFDVLSVRESDADGRYEELLCEEVAP